MALSALALCSRALLKIGAGTLSSFADNSAESEIASNLYPSIRDALLSVTPWSFATAQCRLPRLEDTPIGDYSYAFQLPEDFLRALSAGSAARGRGLDYRLSGRHVHCDSSSVLLTYIFRAQEENFPPFFDQALITRLAAEFCIPLTESTSRSEVLFKLAEDELRRAKLIDAQQDTPTRFESFPLVEVRS